MDPDALNPVAEFPDVLDSKVLKEPRNFTISQYSPNFSSSIRLIDFAKRFLGLDPALCF